MRKREEQTRLQQDLAREQAKIAPLQKKILLATKAIERTKSASVMKSKYREIERHNNSIANLQKKCGVIQNKIAKCDREIARIEKDYSKEDLRVKRKAEARRKQWEQESKQQNQAMRDIIRHHSQVQNRMLDDIKILKSVPAKITVLFMAANPINTDRLCLDEEVRSIQQKVQMSRYRDSIDFQSRWATRSSDILQAINETNPTIVHFSGHGSQAGELILHNNQGQAKVVKKSAITAAMTTASDTLRLVIFNTCFSASQAKDIGRHIDAAIGMSDTIGDDAAIVFAASLYSALGFGHSLQKSFDQALAALLLEGIEQEDVPKLFIKENLSASDIVLVSPEMNDEE